MDMPPDLVSKYTRSAVRNLVSSIPVGAIREYWENEDFNPIVDTATESQGGVRKRVFDSYESNVCWSDGHQAERGIRVFEAILRRLVRDSKETGVPVPDLEVLYESLARDGYSLNGKMRIVPLHPQGFRVHLANLKDPSGITAELDRIRRAAGEYPAEAIGASKQLIEATAKVVLNERGQSFDDKAKLPDLIKQAQLALELHVNQKEDYHENPDIAQSVKRILGSASTLAISIAELRNLYGTGHGRLSVTKGLGVRHARLAVNASVTWCELLLDTLQDPDAPWRQELDQA